jgi:glycosyltransferase involved in cell wall biosynthesis
MTNQPLVSVVVPFLNAEAFLEECIGSVLAQTYPRWELLLVDDGSTDRSTEIARTCATRHPQRVRCLEHPVPRNRGVSAARNAGLQSAGGEYVAFLDADDVWLPEKLDEQVRCLEQHPDAVMVYGRMRYWYSWTGRLEDAARDHEPDPGVTAGTVLAPPSLAIAMLEGVAPAPLPSDALLRVAAVRGVGGFEEQRAFAVYEDRVFFVKMALSGGAYVADRCWVKYRQHDGSSSTAIDRTGRRAEARKAYRAWVDTYLAEHGYRGTRLWRLARQRSLSYRHPLAASLLGRLRRARGSLVALVTRRSGRRLPTKQVQS